MKTNDKKKEVKSSLPKRTRLTNKDRYYINNKDFSNEILECKKTGVLSPKAVNFFVLLAERTIRTKKLKYTDPRDIEDGIQCALEDCLRYWKNFDPSKSEYGPNAFAYFTQMCKNGFSKSWNKMYRYKGVEGSIKFISLNLEGDNEIVSI